MIFFITLTAGAFCVRVKALRNEFSTELAYKERYPALDTDLKIRGGDLNP